jgi:hypothetical protein
MKINEVTSNLNTYVATVRIYLRKGTTISKIYLKADGINHARNLLMHLYGVGDVISLQAVLDKDVAEGTKTLSTTELQVKSLTDQSKRLNQQAKQLKARQNLQKAKLKLQSASNFVI